MSPYLNADRITAMETVQFEFEMVQLQTPAREEAFRAKMADIAARSAALVVVRLRTGVEMKQQKKAREENEVAKVHDMQPDLWAEFMNRTAADLKRACRACPDRVDPLKPNGGPNFLKQSAASGDEGKRELVGRLLYRGQVESMAALNVLIKQGACP